MNVTELSPTIETIETASSTGAASATATVAGGLDDQCILLLSRLDHQVTLLHNPTSAEGRQQALEAARTMLADTLEFLHATQREEMLERYSDAVCLVRDATKKVDQLLDWPSLWGLLGFQTSVEQKHQRAYAEMGDCYLEIMQTLLDQIGASLPDVLQSAEWDASFRPLLADIKRLW
jgi:hypothetical protein